MRSNSALQRKNTPTGTRSKSESRFSRINVIASDSDSEHEEHRSTYSSHLSPLRKSHNTDKAYQTKQSSSNSKKINASNPRKQLFKSIESKQSEDDSTLNVLTPNKRPTSMSQQLLTPSMKEKSKGGEKVSNELSTADNIEPFQDLKNYIEKKIENLRERIGYDLRIKINELKNTIIGADLTSAAGPNLTSTKTRLSVKVPIETLDEFLNYENVLKNDKDEIEALRMFFRVLINSQTKANLCIATIMVATLDKAVELEYSGFGRSVAGNSKRNFNTTKTCIIMKEAIMDKLGEGLETANLQSKISKWLSGAKDRQGGRKFR
ncbi:hypothetical protein DBV15_09346 [Temnothorax longispinosus]|uniref:DUF4806 domain-containing protein n=1 Tax=Temnothorax longispinosus TaxID=300112 RepID=A0A4S2L142_9HYME|nr:hypothetical protein DBV15_09346 [Temnothorax longispinosus]